MRGSITQCSTGFEGLPCLLLQVTGARAERDMLAKENVTLAATTNQLMASATAADDAPTVVQNRQPSQSVFVPASASFGSQRNRTTSAPPTPGADPRLTAAAADSGTAAAGIGSGKGNAAKVTSSQLREIGQMLARLTRENAALIKQRDKLEAAVAPAQAEARKYAAAAATADKEKQVLLEAKNNARQEADAAVLEAQKAVAALKQLSAERDRLQQQVRCQVCDSVCSALACLALPSSNLHTNIPLCMSCCRVMIERCRHQLLLLLLLSMHLGHQPHC